MAEAFSNKALNLLRERLRLLFSIDLRTLALFRTALGAVLLVDMLRRFEDLRAFYTDAGVLPRSWLAELEGPWRVSLHSASGDAWWQVLLLSIAVLAAFALMIGWRARLAAFVSWLLLASLCARNPLILLGGDYLLCCLLFWSSFLPIGARFSVDAALSVDGPPPSNQHYSFASAALILQVVSVYFFSALLKTGKEWWPEGSAVYYTLSLSGYAWPWSRWLLNYPEPMRWLTYFVYWLELLGPLVALSPIFTRPLRTLAMLLIMLMQVGFLTLLAIGFFPFVSLTAASALIGGGFWDWVARRRRLGAGLHLYLDRDCRYSLIGARLLKTFLLLPRAEIEIAQDHPRAEMLMQANHSWVLIDRDDRAYLRAAALVALLRNSPLFRPLGWLLRGASAQRLGDHLHGLLARHRARVDQAVQSLLPLHRRRFTSGRAAQGLVAVVMTATMAWNWATIGRLPFGAFSILSPILYPGRLEQFWQMFAPFPFKDNGWYVLPGKRVDGTEVDVLRPGKPLSYDEPWSIAMDFPNMRWQVYENRMYDRRFRLHRGYWARYLCREWNRDAPESQRLVSFNIVYMLKRTPPPGESSQLEQVVLWRHECAPTETTKPDGAATDSLPNPVE
jgi:hypothetical protein